MNKPNKKLRLDQLLVQRGLFPSREQAQASIMAGLVRVGGVLSDKAGAPIDPQAAIELIGKPHPYVSRGGLKLEKGLDHLHWSPEGWRAVDLGASTGGFTDCLLQRGAEEVLAVDVGRGQLDMKLQSDARVRVLDKTNARYLRAEDLPFAPDLVTADLAFISLKLIFPVVWSWPAPRLLALIKPQFETEAKFLRKGVVHDPAVHLKVLETTLDQAAAVGWQVQGVVASPLRGPAGNIEFVAGFTRDEGNSLREALHLKEIVDGAHETVS